MKSLLFTFLFFSILQQQLVIFDFNSAQNSNSWRIVNDDVMGGKSTSKISIIDNKGVFQGEVSLENNGGFAMTQYNCELSDVKKFQKIVIHLKGDGKTYQFRIKENRYSRYSYVQNFKTSGKEEVIELSLKDFKPQFRGMKLNMSKFNKNRIEQIALLIGDKKDEKFKIELTKISLN